MSKLDAVLWDLDGTLVDSEPYWIGAEFRLVESFGGTWSEEHALRLVGSPLLVSAAYIREHGGVNLPLPEIVDRLLSEVVAQTRRFAAWRPGAIELLSELTDAGIPCGLVTMSYRVLAEAVIDQLPLGTFTVVVTGDAVRHGKPHPEAYLSAAAALGLDPAQCLAIEDSPAGVGSAEAAGCTVVAVPNQVPIEESPSRTVMSSLDGVRVADLRRLMAARALAG